MSDTLFARTPKSVLADDVLDAVLRSDTARVVGMLEDFGVTRDGAVQIICDPGVRGLTSQILSTASMVSYRDGCLDERMAEEIIDRTARMVMIFPFLRVVTAFERPKIKNYDLIPEKVRMSLLLNMYTDETACAIEQLYYEPFLVMLDYVVRGAGLSRLDLRFNLPILRHIHDSGMIPEYLMLACMGVHLR